MWFFCFLGFAFLLDQQAEAPKKGRLEGKAVHAISGEPVRKANLTLVNPSLGRQGISVTTDVAGVFVFENLEPGEYRLQAEKSGFVRSTYGTRSQFSLGSTVRITAGSEHKDLVMKMTPAASISGRIVDEDGDPMEGAQVLALRRMSQGDKLEWAPVGGAQSNDRGEFRVAGLGPGQYKLSVERSRPGPMGFAAPIQQGKEEYSYVGTFFPGVESLEDAGSISLVAGQEFGGAHLALRKVRVFRIRGRYAGLLAEGQGMRASVLVQAKENNPGFNRSGFGAGNPLNPKDGSFEIANLRPGLYRLRVMQFEGGRPRISGSLEVALGQENLEGVVIPPQSMASVQGRLRIEGETADLNGLGPRSFMVQLTPVEVNGTYFIPPAAVSEDGSFRLENVTPDTYWLVVTGSSGKTYTKAISIGGKEYQDSPMEISAGGTQVEVVLSTRVAKITGSVEKNSAEATPGFVVCERVGGNSPASIPRNILSVDADGKFQSEALSPGEYRIYAFEDVDLNQGRDPEFLKQFAARSVRMKIGEGEAKSVTLKQIPASEVDEAKQ